MNEVKEAFVTSLGSDSLQCIFLGFLPVLDVTGQCGGGGAAHVAVGALVVIHVAPHVVPKIRGCYSTRFLGKTRPAFEAMNSRFFIFTSLHLHLYIYIFTFTSLYLYLHNNIFTFICLNLYVYIYMFTFTCLHLNVYI